MISFGKFRQMHPDVPSDKESETMSAIASALEQFEQRTNRLWLAREGHIDTIRTTHQGARSLFLSMWPVTELTTVETKGRWSDGVSILTGDWEELTVDDECMIASENDLVRIDGLNWTPLVRVTYDGGYAVDLGPEDVLRAIAVQARFILARYDAERLVTSSSATEGGSTNYVSSKSHPLFDDTATRRRRIA